MKIGVVCNNMTFVKSLERMANYIKHSTTDNKCSQWAYWVLYGLGDRDSVKSRRVIRISFVLTMSCRPALGPFQTPL